MHDTPATEPSSAREEEIQRYAESLGTPVALDHSPLAVEDPRRLRKMIRLLRAHAKGPEAFDRERTEVQALNGTASSTPAPSGNPR
jgi:hypothetical protein